VTDHFFWLSNAFESLSKTGAAFFESARGRALSEGALLGAFSVERGRGA